MRITEIINESMDLANAALKMPYGASGSDFDKLYNPEIVNNIEYEYKRYKEIGENPVFLKDANNKEKKFTTKPEPNTIPSPGFSGREKVLNRAGIKKIRP